MGWVEKHLLFILFSQSRMSLWIQSYVKDKQPLLRSMPSAIWFISQKNSRFDLSLTAPTLDARSFMKVKKLFSTYRGMYSRRGRKKSIPEIIIRPLTCENSYTGIRMLRIFVQIFSLCELVRRSPRSSGAGNQVDGYYRMLFQKVIYQHKKNMARVCNLYRERDRSIKIVLFLIVGSESLSSGETVPTKWRPCEDET